MLRPQCCFHGDIILNMTNLTLQIFSIPLSCHIFVPNNPLYNLAYCRLYKFLLFIVSLLVLESKFHEGRDFCLCSLMSWCLEQCQVQSKCSINMHSKKKVSILCSKKTVYIFEINCNYKLKQVKVTSVLH